jgi:uroporphyrinogen decarboxylase
MSLYLDTVLKTKKSTVIPVWMMRQAGRYLPEYREIRKKYSFLDMVYTPEIAAEITLQPITRFGFDAAILFSDILVVPQVFGLKLEFLEKVGPKFSDPINSDTNIDLFPNIQEKLNPIYNTIKLCKSQLSNRTALIGFAGAPFTVASYMCEGGSSKDLKKTKNLLFSNPQFFHKLLNKITDVTISYLHQQVLAGVDALQLFDTWISHLDWHSCEEFSSKYIKRIVSELRKRNVNVPVTFFGKHTSLFFPLYETTGINVVSVDWGASLDNIDKNLDKSIGIQGNLDPFILYSSKDVIQKNVLQICNSVSPDRPFVFNLGHGLMPDIPIDSIHYVLDAIRS